MARKSLVFITGANGEVGHGLIDYFASHPDSPEIITLDLHPLDESLVHMVKAHYEGNILDDDLLDSIQKEHEITTIFHLAALLSTSGEKNPILAHEVNVNGTQKLLEMAVHESESRGESIKFIFPGTIAVYGIPDVETKKRAGAINEDQYLTPTTMYGINKLYCENLGRYYTRYYKQLSDEKVANIDFRSVRFPGLISAHTVPSGGTSDYGPEMIHAAAQGKPYECFVRPDTALPFMVMPDGVQALIQLALAKRETLSRQVYNVTGFSLTAQDFADIVREEFPDAEISFKSSPGRQGIVDTWSGDIDDSRARQDWGWSPEYSQEKAFKEYLFPLIRERYQQTVS